MLTGADADRPRRLGHRGRARVDGRHRPDQRAAGARHRSGPQAGRAADAGRHLDGAGADGRSPTSSASSAAGSSRGSSCRWPAGSTGRRSSQGLYMQDVWMGLIKPFVLGFVIVSDRLPRRPADDRRHAGRRHGDDDGGRRRVGRRDRRGLLRDAHPDFVDVLDWAMVQTEQQPSDRPSGEADRSSEPGGAGRRVRPRAAGVRRQGHAEGHQLHADHGHTKIILGASGSGKSTILKIITGLLRADAGRRRG